MTDVIIIGAGLAGLTCAQYLTKQGIPCRVLEANDAVGGRVRTDVVDGFRLDRGFQVFLTAYPDAEALLDYDALSLRRFLPGAVVRHGGRFHRLSDPWRRPQDLVKTAISGAATLGDKLRIRSFRAHTMRGTIGDIYARPDRSTMDLLRSRGFSDVIIERFFRPFLGGVFLDRELATSSRMCEFVFRMFSLGDAALPAEGMEAIPRQLAEGLDVRTDCAVRAIDDGAVTLANGEPIEARAVVVATDAPTAARLLGRDEPPKPRTVRCIYFAADRAPITEPILVLNGDGRGPINNLCVPSAVSPAYAPAGRALVSVTVLPDASGGFADEPAVREQLVSWFGPDANGWDHLRTMDIAYALPDQRPPALDPVQKPAHVRDAVFVCGDFLDTASINGAMASGRRAADAVAGFAAST